MELPQALLEEPWVCGEGGRSHLCKDTSTSASPTNGTGLLQCHVASAPSHPPWLKHPYGICETQG